MVAWTGSLAAHALAGCRQTHRPSAALGVGVALCHPPNRSHKGHGAAARDRRHRSITLVAARGRVGRYRCRTNSTPPITSRATLTARRNVASSMVRWTR